ncbi:MAG: signal peptidase I [Saprospiraceae bacterium]|nr:signal peptidase I [Saprospiraceae bacterium]
MMILLGLIALICGFGMAFLIIASLWRIFEKAGRSGWEALIPIYNAVILLRIVGKPGWWILLFLIPFVNFVLAIYLGILIARSFGQGPAFGLGLIFFKPIFLPVLAFGGYEYLGPAGAYSKGDWSDRDFV